MTLAMSYIHVEAKTMPNSIQIWWGPAQSFMCLIIISPKVISYLPIMVKLSVITIQDDLLEQWTVSISMSNRCNQKENVLAVHRMTLAITMKRFSPYEWQGQSHCALMVLTWPCPATETLLKTYVNEFAQHASGLVWAGQAVWLRGTLSIPNFCYSVHYLAK